MTKFFRVMFKRNQQHLNASNCKNTCIWYPHLHLRILQ